MKNLGILGGGQLARMLVLKTPPLGLKPFVFSASKEDPAAQVCINWTQGHIKESKKLRAFLKKIDILTFESELIRASLIQKTLPKGHKIHIAPSLKILGQMQDRFCQKELLKFYNLPTADFLNLSFSKEIAKTKANNVKNIKILNKVWDHFGPFVLKSREGGYDGYGTFPVNQKKQIKNFKALKGCYIAEALIPFKRELAISAAKNKREIIFTPLVETHQEHSRCLWVRGPVKHKKINSLKDKISYFLQVLNYQGLITFELFDTGSRLLINELAPRVHNSGHYSLNAMSEDQFTLHLKAVLDFPLMAPQASKGFAMLNLLGGQKKSKWETFKKFHFHWYGKTINRPGRKMGHINALAKTPEEALNNLIGVKL